MFPLLLKLPREAYEHRAKILGCCAVFFLALSLRQRERIAHLEAVAAAKPMVQERVVTKVIQGPTKTEYRTIDRPGVERIEERIVYVESKSTERASEHEERPVCPQAASSPRFLAGARLDPRAREPFKTLAPRVGITLGGRVDLAYSKTLSTNFLDGHQVDAAFRFGGR